LAKTNFDDLKILATQGRMENMNENIWIAIAAYNEEKIISEVISEIKKAGFRNIVVVDDGSADNTREKAESSGATSFRHKINRGKGAATKTAIEATKMLGAEIVITMDGDGQHNPGDILRLIAPIQKGNFDVVLGTRLKNPKGMPFHKIVANYVGNFFTWYLYGLWVTDSQSGFRAYSRHAIKLIDTRADRYEYDSEVIREIKKHRLKFTEVPITVRYTEYSTSKVQKQSFLNGLKTLYKMIWNMIS
jgi:UDP-N-acetylglucosamine---dolichyl-phosphate N-acetylglucosaminyltransferase